MSVKAIECVVVDGWVLPKGWSEILASSVAKQTRADIEATSNAMVALAEMKVSSPRPVPKSPPAAAGGAASASSSAGSASAEQAVGNDKPRVRNAGVTRKFSAIDESSPLVEKRAKMPLNYIRTITCSVHSVQLERTKRKKRVSFAASVATLDGDDTTESESDADNKQKEINCYVFTRGEPDKRPYVRDEMFVSAAGFLKIFGIDRASYERIRANSTYNAKWMVKDTVSNYAPGAIHRTRYFIRLDKMAEVYEFYHSKAESKADGLADYMASNWTFFQSVIEDMTTSTKAVQPT
jgi:hypothetical protein